jgi:hypothetical protein
MLEPEGAVRHCMRPVREPLGKKRAVGEGCAAGRAGVPVCRCLRAPRRCSRVRTYCGCSGPLS